MDMTEESKSKIEELEHELVGLCDTIQGVIDDLKVVKTAALKEVACNVVEDSVENIRKKLGRYTHELYKELVDSSQQLFKSELARDTTAVAFDIMVFTTAFLNRTAEQQPCHPIPHPIPEYYIHYDKKDVESLETQGYVVLRLRGYNVFEEVVYDVVADNPMFFEKFISPFMHPWQRLTLVTELSGDAGDLTAEELLEGEDLDEKTDIDNDLVPEEQLKEQEDDAASGLSPYDILQKQMSKRISADLSGDVKLEEEESAEEAPEAVLSHAVDPDNGFLASLHAEVTNPQEPVDSLTSSIDPDCTCPGYCETKGLSA